MRVQNGLLSLLLPLYLLVVPASAATLIVQDGFLMGATGVDVQGTSYDVAFGDGTCNSLFNGCTQFAFTDASSALAASSALLDQVFIDSASYAFDSRPDLTNGCLYNDSLVTLYGCSALTPYGPSSNGYVPV